MKVAIPPRKNRKDQREYDRYLYRRRHRVENAFLHLQRWRGIATMLREKYDFLSGCRTHSVYCLMGRNRVTTLSKDY